MCKIYLVLAEYIFRSSFILKCFIPMKFLIYFFNQYILIFSFPSIKILFLKYFPINTFQIHACSYHIHHIIIISSSTSKEQPVNLKLQKQTLKLWQNCLSKNGRLRTSDIMIIGLILSNITNRLSTWTNVALHTALS